jgi:hypothetical protein
MKTGDKKKYKAAPKWNGEALAPGRVEWLTVRVDEEIADLVLRLGERWRGASKQAVIREALKLAWEQESEKKGQGS